MRFLIDSNSTSLQVTSTSAVNTIVETLIGDWNFFFDGDVNFYETMTRDELFPDNGGFPYDRNEKVLLHPKPDQMMSMSMYVGENAIKNGPATKMSHSRSSSHDTSLILLSDPPLKSSQSNSSLSDTSPTTGSPKLPSRRKQKAPIPPSMTPQPPKAKLEVKVSAPMSVSKLHDTSNFSFIDSDPSLHIDEMKGGMKRAGSSENILAASSKPSRPPPVQLPSSRPNVTNSESQTTSKTIVRQVPLKDKSSSTAVTNSSTIARPVAAPRTTLIKGELEKSDENLLVTLREKPAIPDRPVTLMRPASFRAATGSPTSILTNEKLVEELSATFANKGSSSSSGSGGGGGVSVRRNNSLREGRSSSESNGENVQSKQQVTMYNIEKQQVSIIDVPVGGSPRPVRRELFNNNNNESETNKENLKSSTDALNTSDEHVPPSPRDNKIKRPQVPPPARPRSSDGDSTNL